VADPLTVVCLASYEKGAEFLRECRRQGCRVVLLTVERLAGAPWPREAIDELHYMPSLAAGDDLVHGVSYLARTRRIDRIVALDEFDAEAAALLREHLRVPGMGQTTARYFRDKLAMRARARNFGILVPEFVHVLNHDAVRAYTARVPPPWVLKPRAEASAIGIRKIQAADELWSIVNNLGDRQSFFLLEQYVQGDVYHVDAIVWDRAPCFAIASKYGQPPMDVAHHGGIFTTRTLGSADPEVAELIRINAELAGRLGFVRGVTHTEFIRGRDGRFYFLETAGRVGGANIVEVIEAATGINLWAEWARVEIAGEAGSYAPPEPRRRHAGILISLARQEHPDLSGYGDPEIVWRMTKRHHAGLIVASEDPVRVAALLDEYGRRFRDDFYATAPLPDKPTA
jgi:biotin carboxylase